MVQSFKEQAEFWIQNGFVEDLLRIKGDVGQFINALDQKPPGAKAPKKQLSAWAGFLNLVETQKDLLGYIDFKSFELNWIDTANKEKKQRVLFEAHRSCADRWSRTPTGEQDLKHCAWCELLQPGVNVPAEHLDHIVPFSFFPEFDSYDWNFQGLCAAHNSVKSNFPLPIQSQMTAEQLKDEIWTVLGLT